MPGREPTKVEIRSSESPAPAAHTASPCHNEYETPRSLQHLPSSESSLDFKVPIAAAPSFTILSHETDSRVCSSKSSCYGDSDSDDRAYTTSSSPHATDHIAFIPELQTQTQTRLHRTPRSFLTAATEDEAGNNVGEIGKQFLERYHGTRTSEGLQRHRAENMTDNRAMSSDSWTKDMKNCFTENARESGSDDRILTTSLANCSVSPQMLAVHASLPAEITCHPTFSTEGSDSSMKQENPDKAALTPEVTELIAGDQLGLSQNGLSPFQASADMSMVDVMENNVGKGHHENDLEPETEAAHPSSEFEIPEGYWSDIGVFSCRDRCTTNTRRFTDQNSSSLADESVEPTDCSSNTTDDELDVLSPLQTPFQGYRLGIQTQMLSNILLATYAINCADTHANKSGSFQASKNTPDTGSGKTLKPGMSSAEKQTKKRGLGANDNGPGDNSDEEDDQNFTYIPSGPEVVPKRLACPYFKNNPAACNESRACAGPGWPTLSRVK
jgi:hypothetical protein